MMVSWMEKVKQHFLHKQQNGTDKTDEMPIMSVSSARFRHLPEKPDFEKEVQTITSSLKNPAPNNEHKPSKPDIESAPILTNANTPGSRLLRAKVLKAAMQVCDLWGDGEAARHAMKNDIGAVPDEQLPELLAHFDSTYAAFKTLPGGELKKLFKLMRG